MEGGVVYVVARVGVFTAVVMSPLNLSNIDATAVFGDQLGGVGARGLIKSDNFFLHRSTAVRAVGHDVIWIGKVGTIRKVSFRELLWFPTVEDPVATAVTLQFAVNSVYHQGAYKQNFDEVLHLQVFQMFLRPLSQG